MVYAKEREPVLVAKVLLQYEELLHLDGFIRIHRSHLVNKSYIRGFTQTGNLILIDETRVEVSRRRKKNVRKEFKRYLQRSPNAKGDKIQFFLV
jgi:two-component system, LytTR family, response regulator